jgi:dephospho-CoA kinase
MIVIGLTGGIASGKSTAARMLSELGAVVIDADKVGHEAFLPHTEAWRKVVAAFGKDILGQNEEIDRSKLAQFVFNNPKALKRLNSIMHPLMHEIVRQKIEGLRRQGANVVVLEATLLIEAKWTDLVDQVWVTITPEDAVINRLVSQNGFTEKQARARIKSQTPVAQRAKHADVVIRNDSDVDTLEKRVEGLWRKLQSTNNDCARTLIAEGTDWKQKVKDVLASRQRQVITREGYRPSAVLIPIYENRDEHYIALTKRTQDVMYHKGQISFPGGAHDREDDDLAATALREAFEEIGVRPGDVEILGSLDDQSTYTSRYVITPFVGAIPYPYKFKVSRKEVEELIEVPVSALLKRGCFNPETQDEEGKSHPWGHYVYRKHEITGITARILKQLLDSVFTS